APYFGKEHPLHDPEALLDALAPYPMGSSQLRFYVRYADKARDAKAPKVGTRAHADGHEGCGDGLVIPKYPVPGADPVLPQLRPRHAVEMDPRGLRHRHDEAYAGRPRDLARHLEEQHADMPVDVSARHRHDAMAKYLLPPRLNEDWEHDHGTDRAFFGPGGQMKLRSHLKGKHFSQKTRVVVAPPLRHRHKHRRPVRGPHVADRLDIHPWALARLRTAERVYFALEGTLKADAILTRIIETDARESVFDVPSVTLWKAPELRRFANVYLKSKQVVIVPDADWRRNGRVVTQALLCREYLRALSIDACIAAPPVRDDRTPECTCGVGARFDGVDACLHCKGYLKGVDDFLVSGGELGDLRILGREASSPLALFADADGLVGQKSIRTLARYLRVRRDADRVREELEKHVRARTLSADKDLVIEHNEWTDRLEWRGRVSEWPTFTVPP
ncbi:MAG: hypothetical protein ACRDQZ_24405, partial [Mycobacteriales bacterium]